MGIFFIVGAAIDGNRIGSDNLILIIAHDEKRPIYVALQNNIVSIGIFFPILGGVILALTSYTFLYSLTIALLFLALIASFWVKDLD
jgi:hypothetical protein